MFTEIRLQNFKCYRDTGRVRLRPLTLLIGPNNAGKSTLLQAILMLKQTYEDRDVGEPLITSGPYVDLGSFHDILRGGRRASRATLSVSLKVSSNDTRRVQITENMSSLIIPMADTLNVRFSFNKRRNAVVVANAELRNAERVFIGAKRTREGLTATDLPAQVARHVQIRLVNFLPAIRLVGRPPRSESVIRKVLDYDTYSQAQVHIWRHVFENTSHVEPLRQPVPRYNLLGQMPASELGAGGENLLRVLRNPSKVPGRKGSLLQLMDEWLSSRASAPKELRLQNVDEEGTVQSLMASERPDSLAVNVANMGSGVSQLLPILASAIAITAGDTVLVEQPEIHLHPAAQADLGDVFIENLGGSRQFIVETHSEHLLLRVRRRIAEGLSPDKVSVLFVERVRGEPQITEVRPDRRGHFPNWPRGFFEQGYDEALALARAASKVKARSRR